MVSHLEHVRLINSACPVRYQRRFRRRADVAREDQLEAAV